MRIGDKVRIKDDPSTAFRGREGTLCDYRGGRCPWAVRGIYRYPVWFNQDELEKIDEPPRTIEPKIPVM